MERRNKSVKALSVGTEGTILGTSGERGQKLGTSFRKGGWGGGKGTVFPFRPRKDPKYLAGTRRRDLGHGRLERECEAGNAQGKENAAW